jgi:IS5 family transposase
LLGKRKSRQESLFSPLRRETRVSRELTALKGVLDLGWFREAVAEKFVLDNGRPSISPEVLGCMMVLGYWFNITSDRELCEECEDRLSFREFIGIDDDEEVPVHSSLTHWRQRLGPEVFRGFLERSIEAAVSAGLKPGKCRMFDSTLVKAAADASGPSTVKLTPIEQANDYLEALGDWEDAELPDGSSGCKGGSSGWKFQANKRKLKEQTPIFVNTHDLDAKLLTHPNKKTDFYHKCHYEFDASSGLVINADTEHVADAVKMVEFLGSEKYSVDTAVGDKGFFSGPTQQWLADHEIASMISVPNNDTGGGRVFGLDAFGYDAESDEYVCPAGKRLHRFNKDRQGCARYATRVGACEDCELRDYCFRGSRCSKTRYLKVSMYRQLVDSRDPRSVTRYRRLSAKRKNVCEGSFSSMKHYGGLGRARGVGRDSMAIQAILAGAVHNLKKVLRFIASRGLASQSGASASRCVVGSFVRLLLRDMLSGKRWNDVIRPLAA